MTQTATVGALIATVNAHELHSPGWNLMRQIFPRFVEEMELGRFVRDLMKDGEYAGVRIEHHRLPDGRTSGYQFDIYLLERPTRPDDFAGLPVGAGAQTTPPGVAALTERVQH
jgi:hypothetical protein